MLIIQIAIGVALGLFIFNNIQIFMNWLGIIFLIIIVLGIAYGIFYIFYLWAASIGLTTNQILATTGVFIIGAISYYLLTKFKTPLDKFFNKFIH